jgi:hypothetical protein
MKSNAKQVMQKLQSKFERVRREAPPILHNEGQNFFNKQFREQKSDGVPWKEVQRRIAGTGAFKYAKPKSLRTNPILVGKTRRLKNALNRAAATGSQSANRLVWRVALPYAEIQNETRPFLTATNGLAKALKRKFELIYRGKMR